LKFATDVHYLLSRAYSTQLLLRPQQTPSSRRHWLVPCGALRCSRCLLQHSNLSMVQKGHLWLPMVRRLFRKGLWSQAISSFILTFCQLVGRSPSWYYSPNLEPTFIHLHCAGSVLYDM